MRLRTALLCVGLVLQSCSAQLAFDKIVVFGDSLSDDGGAHGIESVVREGTGSQVEYPGAPYYMGSVYSDGPVYATIVSELLDVPIDNWAVSGATSGAVPAAVRLTPPFAGLTTNVSIPVPPALEQAENYVTTLNGTVSPSALYVIFIGSNDLFGIAQGANVSLEEVASSINDTLDVLYTAGARSFLLPNASPLEKIPALSAASLGDMSVQAQAGAAQLVAGFNALLAELIVAAPAAYPGTTVMPLDIHTLFNSLIANATTSGIDVTTPCYAITAAQEFANPETRTGAVCPDPTQHVFWDSIHPAGWVHRDFGEIIAQDLGSTLQAS